MRNRWFFAGLVFGIIFLTLPMAFVFVTALSIGPLISPLVFAWVILVGLAAHRGARAAR